MESRSQLIINLCQFLVTTAVLLLAWYDKFWYFILAIVICMSCWKYQSNTLCFKFPIPAHLYYVLECRNSHRMDDSLLQLTGTLKSEYETIILCCTFCICVDHNSLFFFFFGEICFVDYITPEKAFKRGSWDSKFLPRTYRVCSVSCAFVLFYFTQCLHSFCISRNLHYYLLNPVKF